jgi:hypothetical protein
LLFWRVGACVCWLGNNSKVVACSVGFKIQAGGVPVRGLPVLAVAVSCGATVNSALLYSVVIVIIYIQQSVHREPAMRTIHPRSKARTATKKNVSQS